MFGGATDWLLSREADRIGRQYRVSQFLMQKISIDVQRGSAAAAMATILCYGDSNCLMRTVTVIVRWLKYSDRGVTKKTAQLQSNHQVQPEISNPVDSSARVNHPAYGSA